MELKKILAVLMMILLPGGFVLMGVMLAKKCKFSF